MCSAAFGAFGDVFLFPERKTQLQELFISQVSAQTPFLSAVSEPPVQVFPLLSLSLTGSSYVPSLRCQVNSYGFKCLKFAYVCPTVLQVP